MIPMASKKIADYISSKVPFSALLFIAALLIVSFAGLWLLKEIGVPQQTGDIELFLDKGTSTLFENDTVTAVAFSSCGDFSIYLDGKEIAKGDGRAQSDILLRQGPHTLEAKNELCASLLHFIVRAKECDGKEKRACAVNGCEGTQTCYNGVYSSCVFPKKTCVPGRKLGCSSDSCKFGYMTCNSCGTGYGPCLPPGTPSGGGCTGLNCN